MPLWVKGLICIFQETITSCYGEDQHGRNIKSSNNLYRAGTYPFPHSCICLPWNIRLYGFVKEATILFESGRVAQSVTCLAADTCLTTDPEVVSLIPAWSHTFVEIDHEIICTVILLPFADSRKVVVSYKRKCVHKVLVNCLVKLAKEKSVVRRTDHHNMTIAVDWAVKNPTKLKKNWNCLW